MLSNLLTCLCGNSLSTKDNYCSECGKRRYKMKTSEVNENPLHSTSGQKNRMKKVIQFSLLFIAFELAQNKGRV